MNPDRVYVGWRYAQVHPEPGPPPRRPRPPEGEQLNPDWLAAQRREENLLNRPLKIAAGGAGVGAVLFIGSWVSGAVMGVFAVVGLIACLFVLGITGWAIWQGEQALRSRIEEEKKRLEHVRDERQRRLNAAHEDHARAYQNWERRRQAYESQQEWYAVTVPDGVDRLDVAGGTLAGWAAMVTTMGAARLSAGSQVTVVDLSEGTVARDLVELVADDDDPLVWVLPGDLPRLNLSAELGTEALADILSLVVSVSEEQGNTRDLSFDNAILERVLSVFAGEATIPQITAALRALAQVGDPRDDLRLGLISDDQLEKITTMFGRGAADRVVIERAWALEAQLRKLETLGSDPVPLPPGRLRIVSTDRRAGVLTNRILGTYVVTALTHALRQAPVGKPWEHTLFLCGAEKLRGDVLDRLIDACEATYTGLVLMYRTITPQVKERLGRGHAAVGFMRLGNAEDARAAAQHIGPDQRLIVAELTDTVAAAVTDSKGESYSSTVNSARSRSSSTPGRSRTDEWLPPVLDDLTLTREPSREVVDGESLTERISRVTGWGDAISTAGGQGDRQGRARKRSREFRVEQHQLQELPPTAMIFTHATPSGRQILLIDANPGILTLPSANLQEYEEALRARATIAERGAAEKTAAKSDGADRDGADRDDAERDDAEAAESPSPAPADPEVVRTHRRAAQRGMTPRDPGSAPPLGRSRVPGPDAGHYIRPGETPPPNLGPPPERLDFRKKRR